MSTPDVLMVVGAFGAVVPLVAHRRPPLETALAHSCMAVLMTAMIMTRVQAWMHVIAAIILSALAFHLVGHRAACNASRLCIVDLTAMAALLLAMPGEGVSHVASAEHHHTSGTAGATGPVVVLGMWLFATVFVASSGQRAHSKGAVAGSILMIVGMAPMAV